MPWAGLLKISTLVFSILIDRSQPSQNSSSLLIEFCRPSLELANNTIYHRQILKGVIYNCSVDNILMHYNLSSFQGHLRNMHACMHTHRHTHTRTHARTHTNTHTHTHTHTQSKCNMHACMHARKTYMCVCVCVCVCV